MATRPEVFISAASKDLKSCRQIVRDALLTLGCVPVVQDHFPPGAGEVRAMLRERIAGCHAVIHLAGECYGFEPQERAPNEPHRSYTQLEYDIARELKKPLYTFLCAPDFPYDAHAPEPEELRLLQEQHRAALAAGDNLYVPLKDTTELNLRVRELQTRVETLSKDLQKTRSWLGRGVAVALVALALIGTALWFQHRRAVRTEQKMVQVSDELDRYRQAVKALADNYGKDIEPGRKLTEQEKFDRALAAVAAQQQVSVGELKTWMAVFVAQVHANPGADFYDKALADFAEKHFADAAANATRSAEQFQAQREAAKKEKAAAGEREVQAAEKERRSWTLVGDSEFAAGHYPASVRPYEQALALIDKNAEALTWCDAAGSYENALARMGRYAEAESLARELVETRTRLQGKENPGTLKSVGNLANVLLARGDVAGAEALYRQDLQTAESTLGKDHPITLATVNNLATLLQAKGDLPGAEALFRRCLETRERTLGKEDPLTLGSVNSLAFLLYSKGDLAAAEPLFRRALEAQERTLGKDHPETLMTVGNLGSLLYAKGDYAGAELFFRRALDTMERTLGPEHPLTLGSVSNLAQLLDAKGDYAAAEPFYLRAEAAMEHALPPEHAYRLDVDYNFSLLRQKQGRLAEALPLAEHAAAGAQKSLPENSPVRRMYEKNLLNLRAKLAGSPASR